MSASKTTISVRLDGDLAEQLEQQIDTVPYDIPKSEVVRTALKEHFERQQSE